MLLRNYGWNKERLIEHYMDNPTKVSIKAGLEREPSSRILTNDIPVSPTATARRSTRKSTNPPQETQCTFICPTCCDDEPPATLALSCKHRFCSNCWSAYLDGKIRDEAECSIQCMESGCTLLVPDSFIRNYTNSKTSERFEELVLRHYVAHIAHLKFCPAPSCTNTVSCTAAATKSALSMIVPTVHCAEGHTFCFGCHIDSDHRPCPCHIAKMWLKKCQDDSETANWIKTNTKECSKCQSTIEKNGGCKYVSSYSFPFVSQ